MAKVGPFNTFRAGLFFWSLMVAAGRCWSLMVAADPGWQRVRPSANGRWETTVQYFGHYN